MFNRFCVAILICLPCSTLTTATGAENDQMVRLDWGDSQIDGKLLQKGPKVVHLLGRDGRLWTVPIAEIKKAQRLSKKFEPYSVSEMRAALIKELGPKYEVVGKAHYLIARPRGSQGRWAELFEQQYRQVVHYFQVRKFDLQKPPFLLVAIVCRDQAEFMRRSKKTSLGANQFLLGYYSLTSNRVALYDQGESDSNKTVVLHEATHQITYNIGLLNRFCQPPLWVTEGTALLFEAPGMADNNRNRLQKERINRQQLKIFSQLKLKGNVPAALTGSDQLFASHSQAAYAISWAMTFYMSEAIPSSFNAYLRRIAAKKPFSQYTAPERLADFTAIFGPDWKQFDANFQRYIDSLGQ